MQLEVTLLTGADTMKPEAKKVLEGALKSMSDEEERFKKEKKEIEQEAKKLEVERDVNRSKDPYFDYAEVPLADRHRHGVHIDPGRFPEHLSICPGDGRPGVGAVPERFSAARPGPLPALNPLAHKKHFLFRPVLIKPLLCNIKASGGGARVGTAPRNGTCSIDGCRTGGGTFTAMTERETIGLQAIVFFVVWAAFTTIYITQPVLPVLQVEFGVDEARASWSISVVTLGIALANLPFGMLADRMRIKPIIFAGGLIISACSAFCAIAGGFSTLVAARFIQGLFIPSLTTCLAAFLSRSLPVERLNVVMGSYVSASVAGGLSGRLLGGWIHPPLHWRYAFVSASIFLLVATCLAAKWLQDDTPPPKASQNSAGFLELLSRPDVLRILSVAFGAYFVFSSIFNYLPFYLSGPPFNAPTNLITMLYLSYIIGIVTGPLAGSLSNRVGNGVAMVLGSVLFASAIALTLVQSVAAIAFSLTAVCAGFFTVHASAAGALNRRLTSSRGRANSLYVLFYYLGGYAGITASGWAYLHSGWHGVAALGILVLGVPFAAGFVEMRNGKL